MNAEASWSEIPFWKAEGTGNDFVIFDLRDAKTATAFQKVSRPDFVKKICDRRLGVGGDGAVFILSAASKDVDFSWDFFNSDGTSANMCGNAARCVGIFGCLYVMKKPECVFQTVAGPVKARVLEQGRCEIEYNLKSIERQSFEVGLMQSAKRAFLVNSGVPHIVIEMSESGVRKEWLPKLRSLRHHPSLGEEGANVTLTHWMADGTLRAVTYERGVEDFTLSCGTGVIAAAIVAMGEKTNQTLNVRNPGGELTVGLDKNSGKVRLQGPAHLVFEGRLNRSFYL